LEKQIRTEGYVVEHIHEGDVSIDSYDLVLVTNYGQSLSDASINITKEFDEMIFGTYKDYIANGGNISFFLNSPQNTNQGYISSINDLGADLSFSIPAQESPTKVSNFSESVLLEGVNGLYFSGSEISALNSSVSSLGWYRYQYFDGVKVHTSYRSIGVEGGIKMGNYWIFGSTLFLTNQYYHQIDQGTEKLMSNFLQII
jgi:hypothetical protein